MTKIDKISLAHGGGGKLMSDLIREVFVKGYGNRYLNNLNDQAVLSLDGIKIAFTTDSYVIDPIFFPGGDIGLLSVYGTINDLAVGGAIPLFLSVSMIIEEGFPLKDLERIVNSMHKAASETGVYLVTGDTKVVNRGSADKIFINTSGIGMIEKDVEISGENLQVGDKILLSGYIGDHGIAVLSKREGLEFGTTIKSDTAPLHSLVRDMLSVSTRIHAMRDPTRGGLASTLNELAKQSKKGILIYEDEIPVRQEVQGACEFLGMDPLYLANEGKLVASVVPHDTRKLLAKMRKNRYGKQSRIIGEVLQEPAEKVIMKTSTGGTRIVDMLVGDQLPRIC